MQLGVTLTGRECEHDVVHPSALAIRGIEEITWRLCTRLRFTLPRQAHGVAPAEPRKRVKLRPLVKWHRGVL